MKRKIAVIGAGPSGAHLAHELAVAGHAVRLYDLHRGPWEKPCGGGITAKALREFDFLMDAARDYPRQDITEIEIISPRGNAVTFGLSSSFVIFSRRTLFARLLDRARAAGAEFFPERVNTFQRDGNGWTIAAESGDWRADFLVGADGCTSFVRRTLIGKLPDADQAMTCGYYLPAPGTTRAVVAFPSDFTGYVWAFPRVDHISYGIINACDEYPLTKLWEILDRFVVNHSGQPLPAEKTKYAARVPMLRKKTWKTLTNSGDGWALVGDAAGFVDPITGEGIYYALRSAHLLAEAIKSGDPTRYENLWRKEFEADLTEASRRLPKFYRGSMLGGPVIDRVVKLAGYHGGVQDIMARALAGDVDYTTLKGRVLRSFFTPSTWTGRKLEVYQAPKP